ncbi:LuxE/PaaK family acyltransferase [Pseudarthrobacter sp. ATCC 49987]|jgi:hypothetical protein|uniref:LuxE/PaaK family acyltransferase n=1 Tax=Pseudarthrobacter sp. ATCC 49987 TaxID=2698204 RepID=UPI00136A7D44|nr:hypothetical protein [Pseudarthrobacter sp. ATCC 49987]
MTAAQDTPAPGIRDGLDLRIQSYIERGAAPAEPDDSEFGQLALDLFAYQYDHNPAYRRFCRSRRAEPGRLTSWEQIPPVPLAAFKELTLACEPPEKAAAIFMTSGSTNPGQRGRNHHPHLHLYDASLRAGFAQYFLPDRERIPLLVLNARPQEQPHSSLAYFFGRLVDFFGAPGSAYFMDKNDLQWRSVAAALQEAEATGEPVALLGTSFAYVHLLDAFEKEGLSFRLPKGSRLLDTGGFKGRSREVSAEDLRDQFRRRLGIPDPWCVNYYGMTEISTQYYDTTLRDSLQRIHNQPRHKVAPAWTRIRVVDPESGASAAPGQKGLIVHYDLANRGSCLAVLAEDIGYLTPPGIPQQDDTQGFVLLGRAEGTEARGCSIALDEILAANRD